MSSSFFVCLFVPLRRNNKRIGYSTTHSSHRVRLYVFGFVFLYIFCVVVLVVYVMCVSLLPKNDDDSKYSLYID